MHLKQTFVLAITLIVSQGPSALGSELAEGTGQMLDSASTIVENLDDPNLQSLISDVLERNPRIASLTAEAHADAEIPAQVRALPDPTASLTLFLLQPQTRVGPQQAAVGLNQRFPWFGKLKLKEQAALLDAVSARSRVNVARLDLVTRVRTLYHQLQFLERERRIVLDDQSTLKHYEQLAQTRYASGIGIGQTVIKIQAEITRARTRLLEIEERRVSIISDVNALRDRSHNTPAPTGDTPPKAVTMPSFESMRMTALGLRPEIAGIEASIEASGLRVELAEKGYKPDFSAGLNYGWVGNRTDTAGQINPPEGNGDDILSLTGGINLPVWRKRLSGAVEEAIQTRLAAEESRRAIIAEIQGELSEQARTIPLIADQLRLFDEILAVQAEESLRSAEAAYASGTVGALDLLDAERVLLRVRIAAEKARTDLATAIATLEDALASPLQTIQETD